MIRFKSFSNVVIAHQQANIQHHIAMTHSSEHRKNCLDLTAKLIGGVIYPDERHAVLLLSGVIQKHLASIHRKKNFNVLTTDLPWFVPKMVACGILVEKKQYVRPNGKTFSVVRMTPESRLKLIELIKQNNDAVGELC